MADRVVSHGYFRFLNRKTKPRTRRSNPNAASDVW
jgi:hypothetical protein